MSPECLNWPPSRGPNPHTHLAEIRFGKVERKDLPKPPECEVSKAEREFLQTMSAHVKARMAQGSGKAVAQKALRPKGLLKTLSRDAKKPPLGGDWSVYYYVRDVLTLSAEQADRMLMACPLPAPGRKGRPDRKHLDRWWRFEPRTLWVDLTYPLARGVRLAIHPAVEFRLCKTCGDRRPQREEPIMSPGYLLWTLAKEYERIYAEHEKYGVWGHAIDDLCFERISIRPDGVTDVFMGS